MTDPEGTQQDAELNPESSTDEATADVDEEPSATEDYQTRMRDFEHVESPVPVTSTPVTSPEESP